MRKNVKAIKENRLIRVGIQGFAVPCTILFTKRTDCMPSLYRFTCIFLCLFFISLQSQAQITDDFSDGNFTSNPAWQGDAANFVVNASGELQLMAPGAGSSVLLVEGLIADSAVWELDIRLEFAPSTSNLLRIYLFADQSDLAAANGYYLEIGETGSMDALRFFRQDAGVGTLLLTGQLGGVASDPVDKRIRVKRSTAGGWTLEMRNPGGSFAPEGSVSDASYAPGGVPVYFGFECLYTATRVDLFYFDNISIQADVPDLDPPQLLSASLDSPTQLLVSFDEILDQSSAELVGNYTVLGIGNPVLAELNANLQSVTLSFANPFPTGNYTLESNLIADALGNVSGVQSADFSYVLVENAEEFDVLINEIMADPSPSAGLPEVEWLELYNRSDKIIDLSSLQLSDGGTAQSLPAVLLQPDSFFVLCSTSSASAFSGLLSNYSGMVGFPSLNNSGENLVLTRGSVQIDQVDFSLNWHTDPDKQDGGWTLERINPLTPCLGGDNWQSCPTIPGGTPGAANASLQEGPDTDAPYLVDALPISATEVLLRFSEGLEQGSAVDPDSYVFDPVLTISSAEIYAGNRAEVLLTLLDPMASGQVYSLRSNANLLDCSGNASDDTQVLLLGLPEKPEPQDLILNEVLFNPATGGTRFVEVYNQSDKILCGAHFSLLILVLATTLSQFWKTGLFCPVSTLS
ncbi:MAG: lamin tail domain-containing protein [Saprospiraceae bacterium]